MPFIIRCQDNCRENDKIWATFGLIDVQFDEDGFLFFQFHNVCAFREVEEAGPWYFGGRLLVLKQWHSEMWSEKEQLKKIPLWVPFHNFHLELQN